MLDHVSSLCCVLLFAVLAGLMNRLLWNFLSWSSPNSDSGDKSTFRALPSTWYKSEELYELERRAIFSRRWILVTHRLRFPNSGDWVRFQEAGFQFFLCRDREGNIKGFHNVCRHRAFPVVTEEKGHSKIFSCQYHGWSYGLNGKLAKAPGYQDMEGFDKSHNNLFPIHVHVDAKGFIWVNLDAAETPQVSWSDDFAGIDQLPRHEPINFDEYKYDHSWGMSGDYNWKTLADNYNECYHCATSHPDVSAVADLSVYTVQNIGGNIQHFPGTTPDQEKAGLTVVSNFYFPNACMSVTPNFFYMMRCVPTSANHCSMEYDVYRHKDASDEDFEKIDSMFKRILHEDKWLCNNAQKNLNAGVFVNGEMHPKMESGPGFFQKSVREHILRHRKLEEATGEEIWPARQILPGGARESKEDLEFCSGLACSKARADLAW